LHPICLIHRFTDVTAYHCTGNRADDDRSGLAVTLAYLRAQYASEYPSDDLSLLGMGSGLTTAQGYSGDQYEYRQQAGKCLSDHSRSLSCFVRSAHDSSVVVVGGVQLCVRQNYHQAIQPIALLLFDFDEGLVIVLQHLRYRFEFGNGRPGCQQVNDSVILEAREKPANFGARCDSHVTSFPLSIRITATVS